MKHANVLISLCLVLVASGVIAYVYIGPKGSEGSNNLTERVNKIESRLSEQLVLPSGELDMNTQTIRFWMMHIGTANVTISQIQVNNVLNSSGPGWEGPKTLAPGQLGEITLYGRKYFAEGFTDENDYLIAVTTTRGNTFYLHTYALTFTFKKTEQLIYTEVDFGTDNTTITVTVESTGTADVTITKATVSGYGVSQTIDLEPDVTVPKGDSKQIALTLTGGEEWTEGRAYDIELLSSQGNKFTTRAIANPT